MKQDLTDITVVLDRSGSMSSCQIEAENGLNHFIDEQKKQPGECLLTLVQFDNAYEFVHTGKPIQDIPKFRLIPRGMTALLDAVGRAINETGDRLSKMDESNRPALVVFVILTDGMENASHEFRHEQIKQMIERQQKDYHWQFTFLGANQDAFASASAIGIAAVSTANYSGANTHKAFASAGSNVMRMRCATRAGETAASIYTEKERAEMK